VDVSKQRGNVSAPETEVVEVPVKYQGIPVCKDLSEAKQTRTTVGDMFRLCSGSTVYVVVELEEFVTWPRL
jgi:allophanate hydrolase subunit 1